MRGWVFVLWLLAGAARADVFDHPQTAAQLLQGPLVRPAASLRNASVVRGKFVYRKYLREIPQPLVSRGEFTFIKNVGIDWYTREPFDSDFVLTPSGMKQIDDGKTTVQLSASEQPALRVVAQIFLSLLSLDVTTLQGSFKLFGEQQPTQWQVGLKPTVPAIAAVFSAAVVSGNSEVQQLLLHDANGDRTEINFSDTQYAAAPNAQDLKRFNP